MNGRVTCIQWARLVQVAEAHGIQWKVDEHLGAPYRVIEETRTIYLDGQAEAGYDTYMAFASALCDLIHDNVTMLYRGPEQLLRTLLHAT